MITPEIREEIIGLLQEYRDAKTAVKDIKVDLIQLAVEHCHGVQAKLKDGDVAAYLDGVLVGAGIMQEFRREL